MVFLSSVALIYLCVYLQSPQRKRPEVWKHFDEFRARLTKLGLDVKPGYTPTRLARESQQAGIQQQQQVNHLAELFEQHFYTESDQEPDIRQALKNWH